MGHNSHANPPQTAIYNTIHESDVDEFADDAITIRNIYFKYPNTCIFLHPEHEKLISKYIPQHAQNNVLSTSRLHSSQDKISGPILSPC